MPAQIGKNVDEIVLRQVGQYCSNAMSTVDLIIFLDVAKTTSDVALKFLRPWRRYISDPSVFSVLPQTFKTIASQNKVTMHAVRCAAQTLCNLLAAPPSPSCCTDQDA